MCCAEHLDDAFEVVSHDGDAHFGLRTRQASQQQAVLGALRFKCDLLWAQLDGLYLSYVAPGLVPPGAFET